MGMLKNRNFWFGFAAGVIVWNFAIPRFAPNLKSKLPL